MCLNILVKQNQFWVPVEPVGKEMTIFVAFSAVFILALPSPRGMTMSSLGLHCNALFSVR